LLLMSHDLRRRLLRSKDAEIKVGMLNEYLMRLSVVLNVCFNYNRYEPHLLLWNLNFKNETHTDFAHIPTTGCNKDKQIKKTQNNFTCQET
jgi:hypothetical protein